MGFISDLLGGETNGVESDIEARDTSTLRTILSENADHINVLNIWEHPSGYDCLTIQHQMGHYCGYVGTNITEDHRPRVNVHGGITYGPDDEGWIGFDCNHHRDIILTRNGRVVITSATSTAIDRLPTTSEYGTVTNYTRADVETKMRMGMDYLFWTPAKVKRETNLLATKLATRNGRISSMVDISIQVTGNSSHATFDWKNAQDFFK